MYLHPRVESDELLVILVKPNDGRYMKTVLGEEFRKLQYRHDQMIAIEDALYEMRDNWNPKEVFIPYLQAMGWEPEDMKPLPGAGGDEPFGFPSNG